MDKEQEIEWEEAQRTIVSVDLVAAAKQQIQFLQVIDRNRRLYEGPGLQKAIHRYNACWLPLLAAHSEYQVPKGPLVVPLDCEWIWHCHRLNPVRYKSDCEELYGKIIDNCSVVSSIKGLSKNETEEIWNRIYPEEPYELNIVLACSEATPEKPHENCVKYDLASAVERQSPFVYQVSRAHMNHDLFLQEAFSRYKGFLHLKRRNEERSISQFNVPTYDIDLMWHSHILHPVYYCMDTTRAIGKILDHVEDADRTKGKRLDKGFSDTTKQWEETFGTRYSKAGAMFRGLPPKPVSNFPYKPNVTRNRVVSFAECPDLKQLIAPIPVKEIVEVYIEIIGARNLPNGLTEADSVSVFVSKETQDAFFTSKRKLGVMSLSGQKQIACLQCEPSGKFLFELVAHSKPSKLHFPKADKSMGSFLLPLSDFLPPVSKLSVEKWFELSATSVCVSSKPLSLRVAVSFALPTKAPTILLMEVPSKPASRNFCFFPFQVRTPISRSLTQVQDVTGKPIISLRKRYPTLSRKSSYIPALMFIFHRMVRGFLVVECITTQGVQLLAKRVKGVWYLDKCSWTLRRATNDDDFIFEFKGNKIVRFYPGRKLDYEPKCCSKGGSETEFLTAIEFSEAHPFGKAIAVLNWKSGYLVVAESWFILRGIVLSYILSDVMKREEVQEQHSKMLSRSTDMNQKINEYFNGERSDSEEYNAELKPEIFEPSDNISRRKDSQPVRVVPII
ncbi:unnamed protein product [Rhodiola kirilowii]